MTLLELLELAMSAALAAAVVYFRLRARNLARELALAVKQANEWAALLALAHDTNYRLACRLYGAPAVNLAIRRARAKGVS